MIRVLFNVKKCRMELLMLQNLWPTLYSYTHTIYTRVLACFPCYLLTGYKHFVFLLGPSGEKLSKIFERYHILIQHTDYPSITVENTSIILEFQYISFILAHINNNKLTYDELKTVIGFSVFVLLT